MGSYLPPTNYRVIIEATRPFLHLSSAERSRDIQLIRTDSFPKFVNSFRRGGEPV
jgi:hypothetical protein